MKIRNIITHNTKSTVGRANNMVVHYSLSKPLNLYIIIYIYIFNTHTITYIYMYNVYKPNTTPIQNTFV